MRLAVNRARLPPDIVLYSLRHAAISEMLTSGLDPLSVAKLAGTSVFNDFQAVRAPCAGSRPGKARSGKGAVRGQLSREFGSDAPRGRNVRFLVC